MIKLTNIAKAIIISIIAVIMVAGSAQAAPLNVHYVNEFSAYQNPFPGQTEGNLVVIQAGVALTSDQEDLSAEQATAGIRSQAIGMDTEFELLSTPVLSNSPMKLSEGAELGFGFKGAANLEIRYYDMRGNQIARQDISQDELQLNSQYAQLGEYNGRSYKVTVDATTLGPVSVGVYFFVMTSQNKVIANGKFAVVR